MERVERGSVFTFEAFVRVMVVRPRLGGTYQSCNVAWVTVP